MPHFRNHLRTIVSDTRGAEIAEAAAVLPLMFMILIGIFWFGQAFSIYGAITRAAQEGARAGAVPDCATCSTNNANFTEYATHAVNAVQNALSTANLNPSLARYPATPPAFASCASGSAGNSCNSAASNNVCVQMPVQLSSSTTGAAGVCGVSVSFQYPFQFWLPFTSLNNQQVWMTASARVRLETH